MEKYDPETAPDQETWLALDEDERHFLVTEFVKRSEQHLDESAKRVHAAIHVIIENQIAMQEEPAPETCERLVREGLGRHDAIHALGAVFTEDLFDLMKGNKDAPFEKYKGRMKKLTAKRWKKGKQQVLLPLVSLVSRLARSDRQVVNAIESEAMKCLLAGEHPYLATLRAQLALAKVRDRDYTGVGFFTESEVTEGVRKLRSGNYTI